jgi:hypothetical protein
MLGLGSLVAGSNNYNTSNTDDSGYFEKSYTLNADVTLLQLAASKIVHGSGTPGILITNFTVALGGVKDFRIFFRGDKLIQAAETTPVVVHSRESISFDDNVGDNDSNNVIFYRDNTSNSLFPFANTAGVTITVSGNITLNDGTNTTYAGDNAGRVEIVFNSTEEDNLFVFAEPGVTASEAGDSKTIVVGA